MLTLDLPGLTPEDIVIEVHDNQLTVRGERPRPQVEEGVSYLYTQRPYGAFEHRVGLPRGVDPDSVTAAMQNGVLSLIVPRPEAAKPRQITIATTQEDRQLESVNA